MRSRSAILEQQFVGEGSYDLCLRIGELVILQEKTGVGPMVLATRIFSGEYFIHDIIETIRLGLIGGGMKHEEARKLVDNYVVPGYFGDYVGIAGNLLYAAISGVEDEPLPGKP